MRKWMTFIVLAILALGAAYLGGFWPQWQKVKAAQAELQAARQRISALERTDRFCRLRSMLMGVQASFQSRNYGIAQSQAQEFFAAVTRELAEAGPEERTALLRIGQQKSTLIEGLAASDPSSAPVSDSLTIIGDALGSLELGVTDQIPK